MTGNPTSFMPFWIGDHLADTAHLTTLEQGAYILLLFHSWRTRSWRTRRPLPDDDVRLAQIARMNSEAWSFISSTIREFFTPTDDGGGLFQKRLEEERVKAERTYTIKKAASEKANEAKKAQRLGRENRDGIRDGIRDGDRNGGRDGSQPQPQPQPQLSSQLHQESKGQSELQSEAELQQNSVAIKDSWDGYASKIKMELGPGVFESWLGDAILESGPPARIVAATPFKADYIQTHLFPALERVLGDFSVEVRQ